MSSPKLSLPERFLTWLSDLVYHRPRWFIYPQIVLFIVCVVYTVMALGFNTKRNDLVGGEKKYHQNFLKYKEEFPRQDDLVVVVEKQQVPWRILESPCLLASQ